MNQNRFHHLLFSQQPSPHLHASLRTLACTVCGLPAILFLLEASFSSVVLILLLFGLVFSFLDGSSNLFSNWFDLWWLFYNRSRFFSHKGNFFHNHWFWFFLRNRLGLFNFVMFLFLFSLLFSPQGQRSQSSPVHV